MRFHSIIMSFSHLFVRWQASRIRCDNYTNLIVIRKLAFGIRTSPKRLSNSDDFTIQTFIQQDRSCLFEKFITKIPGIFYRFSLKGANYS